MAKKKEEVVEETTQPTVKTVEETKFDSVDDDSVIKIDLNKPPTPKEEKHETKEDNPDDKGVVAVDDNTDTTEKQKEVQPEQQTQKETPVLEEITDEEEVKDEATELTEELIDAKIEEVEI